MFKPPYRHYCGDSLMAAPTAPLPPLDIAPASSLALQQQHPQHGPVADSSLSQLVRSEFNAHGEAVLGRHATAVLAAVDSGFRIHPSLLAANARLLHEVQRHSTCVAQIESTRATTQQHVMRRSSAGRERDRDSRGSVGSGDTGSGGDVSPRVDLAGPTPANRRGSGQRRRAMRSSSPLAAKLQALESLEEVQPSASTLSTASRSPRPQVEAPPAPSPTAGHAGGSSTDLSAPLSTPRRKAVASAIADASLSPALPSATPPPPTRTRLDSDQSDVREVLSTHDIMSPEPQTIANEFAELFMMASLQLLEDTAKDQRRTSDGGGEVTVDQPTVILSGFLQKSNSMTWKQKYCIVRPGVFSYASSPAEDPKKWKVLELNTDAWVCSKPPSSGLRNQANVFQLSFGRAKRIWRGKDADECRRWMEAIAQAAAAGAARRGSGGTVSDCVRIAATVSTLATMPAYMQFLRDCFRRPLFVPLSWVRSRAHQAPLVHASLNQVFKDAQRDSFVVNDCKMIGSNGFAPVIGALATSVFAAASHLGLMRKQSEAMLFAKDILVRCTRTTCGGDIFDALFVLFHQPELVLLRPMSEIAFPLKFHVTTDAHDWSRDWTPDLDTHDATAARRNSTMLGDGGLWDRRGSAAVGVGGAAGVDDGGITHTRQEHLPSITSFRSDMSGNASGGAADGLFVVFTTQMTYRISALDPPTPADENIATLVVSLHRAFTYENGTCKSVEDGQLVISGDMLNEGTAGVCALEGTAVAQWWCTVAVPHVDNEGESSANDSEAHTHSTSRTPVLSKRLTLMVPPRVESPPFTDREVMSDEDASTAAGAQAPDGEITAGARRASALTMVAAAADASGTGSVHVPERDRVLPPPVLATPAASQDGITRDAPLPPRERADSNFLYALTHPLAALSAQSTPPEPQEFPARVSRPSIAALLGTIDHSDSD